MIRILVFVALVALAIFAAVLVAERPGAAEVGGADAGAGSGLAMGQPPAGAGILAQRVLRFPNIVRTIHGKRNRVA